MSESYTPMSRTMRSVYIDAQMAWCPFEDHVRAKRRREVADEFDRWLDAERRAARVGGMRAGWEEAVEEAADCGWIHADAVADVSDRNPYRNGAGL